MPIQVELAKWGNGLGPRVPKDIAARLGLVEGGHVDIEALADGRLIVIRSRPRYTLDELLTGMTPDREHPLDDDKPAAVEIV
ncbi:MAG: AbrB/MazE/SpoVT family DNA-binding domain-containing protein [Alphaproteobacteria bacterium]|nr:AbrB/MazE/SpoVT family DNA-binding domain-containing protein [Alphaproteobacteria bacterium]